MISKLQLQTNNENVKSLMPQQANKRTRENRIRFDSELFVIHQEHCLWQDHNFHAKLWKYFEFKRRNLNNVDR